METFEILIAYTALMTTLVGGLLAFLFYQYFPLKSKIEILWHDVYDNGSAGWITQSEERVEELDDRLGSIEDDNREVCREIRGLQFEISRLVDQLESAESMDEIDDVGFGSDPQSEESG